MQYFYSPPVGLIDELPLGDPNSLGSNWFLKNSLTLRSGLKDGFIHNEQGLADLPYKLSWPPAKQKNLANLAGKTQNLANLADINSNLANLADINSNLANLADMN